MYKKDSGLEKNWFGAVLNGTYRYKDVPNLSNLRQVVGDQLTDMGYDINAENAAA